MNIHFIRHATFHLYLRDLKILVDPMLSPAGSMAAAPNAANQKANPLVELPIPMEEILKDVDAILVTHSHRDHLDDKAMKVLPKDIPVFCQPADQEHLAGKGFRDVRAIERELFWKGLRITRTGGQHGVGEMGRKMGPVSGFVFHAEDEPVTYIVGDSVWCEEVEKELKEFVPDVLILFAGAAQFLTGGAITMDEEDIKRVSESSPYSQIIVAHMEAWNHCLMTRGQLWSFVERNGLNDRVRIPEDGDRLEFR